MIFSFKNYDLFGYVSKCALEFNLGDCVLDRAKKIKCSKHPIHKVS